MRAEQSRAEQSDTLNFDVNPYFQINNTKLRLFHFEQSNLKINNQALKYKRLNAYLYQSFYASLKLDIKKNIFTYSYQRSTNRA